MQQVLKSICLNQRSPCSGTCNADHIRHHHQRQLAAHMHAESSPVIITVLRHFHIDLQHRRSHKLSGPIDSDVQLACSESSCLYIPGYKRTERGPLMVAEYLSVNRQSQARCSNCQCQEQSVWFQVYRAEAQSHWLASAAVAGAHQAGAFAKLGWWYADFKGDKLRARKCFQRALGLDSLQAEAGIA